MPLEVLGFTKNVRTKTDIVYAKSDIATYLSIVGDNFDDFEIQRRRVKHKAYSRMKQDIKDGALLPSITLSIKNSYIDHVLTSFEDKTTLQETLSTPNKINILDGLQRTHILHELMQEGFDFHPEQTLLLEFWLERNINNLIYRIIVLNAGQKPMSIRHQMELLFLSAKENLEAKITGLELFTERDESRRTKSGKYQLERIALAYYSYITKSPEVDKDNLIAQQLQEEKILFDGEDKFGAQFNRFVTLLERYVEVDAAAYDKYNNTSLTWLGSENTLQAFFSAAGNFDSRGGDGQERVNRSISSLIESLRGEAEDPLYLNILNNIIDGLPSRKVNVGFASRKLMFNSFREYFRNYGEDDLCDVWPREAE